jgi:GxGYxYP putative glycoside hydrolase C-terminal domain/GxGYxY sequence motif in domain of unknown function N-terminal
MNQWIPCGRLITRPSLFLLVLCFQTAAVLAGPSQDRWWPVQAEPKAVIRTQSGPEPFASRQALEMMLQSVAGLAAKAVNEGHGDEMVWVNNGNVDLEDWYARLRAKHPALRQTGTLSPWDLVERFAKRGIIKGYILYRSDKSQGENNAYRPAMDCSVNVATSLAGLLDGIIVDEDLEKEAEAHGLKQLLDVREKTQKWCFETYQARFSRRMLCTQDPRKPHVRDLAIAQKAFTVYGKDEPVTAAMAWLEPLSPILGWNGGDEFETTMLSTSYGHIQTATDWCMNLPVLMAGTEAGGLPRVQGLDPATIDWDDSRSAVSFMGTDGDNVQWFQGNFFRGDKSYWGNPDRGKVPYGWSTCFAQLAQLCPQAIDYALATRSTNDWFIEWGGGYYFPDHFGSKRTNRWELLAFQARRTWALMKQTNTRMIGFNFENYNSPEAHQAYRTLASQTDGLLAILVFQYSRYEAGAGETFWVKDGAGVDVPVVTARYSLWEHQNAREHSGTPAKVAREIRQTVEKAPKVPRHDWIIAHAWSYFKHAPGRDENTEDMKQENAAAQGGLRGYSPVTWCAERLPSSIRVISPEELIWRIRMNHNPSETKEFMRHLR